MNGKISIIMGIYNCSDTLPQALDSIIAQTYTNWQLILCDDASTDDTYKVANEYKNKYPDKIVLIKNEVNSKLAFTLNHCLSYADGDFIARMDGDDISASDRFEKQIEYLRKHPEFDLVGTAMQRFDGEQKADVFYPPEFPNYFTLRDKVPFCHATILAKSYVYKELKGYTVSKRTVRCEDFDFWFRFYKLGFNGANLMIPLYLVRENINAIKRRTAQARWDALKTTWIGFKLLDYPKIWLFKTTLLCIAKMLTPYKIVEVYRMWQSKNK